MSTQRDKAWAREYDRNWGTSAAKTPLGSAFGSGFGNPKVYKYGQEPTLMQSMSDYTLADKNGNYTKMGGWGMPALQLAGSAFNTWSNWQNGKDQLKLAEKAWENENKLGWSNYALNKGQAYDERNMNMATLAANEAYGRDKNINPNDYVNQFSDLNSLYDTEGRRIADPAVNVSGEIFGGNSNLPGQTPVGSTRAEAAANSSFKDAQNPAASVEATNTAVGLSNAAKRSKLSNSKKKENQRINNMS